MSLISDFCRNSCPFAYKNNHSDCPCLDDKYKCPVDYYQKWLNKKLTRDNELCVPDYD